MVIRQLRQEQYDQLTASLLETAHTEPMEASYTVRMDVNGMEYAVKLQPERHCKIAVLQAQRVDRIGGAPLFELITQGSLLSSLLELLLAQKLL